MLVQKNSQPTTSWLWGNRKLETMIAKQSLKACLSFEWYRKRGAMTFEEPQQTITYWRESASNRKD